MNLFKFTKMAFIRAFDFSGRSSRQEFWWFQLGIIILGIPYYCLIYSCLFVSMVGLWERGFC